LGRARTHGELLHMEGRLMRKIKAKLNGGREVRAASLERILEEHRIDVATRVATMLASYHTDFVEPVVERLAAAEATLALLAPAAQLHAPIACIEASETEAAP
jgi:hypothetical protein